MRRRPELLAPVGSPEALVAAVQSGADAVYLGTGSFNARRTASQFSDEALTRAVRYCHERGVLVYITLNTMVREDEYPTLKSDIRAIAAARADAVLVQDLGVARLLRRMVPGLPLHASTQLAAHNRSAVKYLASQGFERVVLAREMSLPEIAACTGLGTELEVFVHGALCVACSGQCLLSSLVGGRSGNRGRCAQPCRREYRMDGKEGYLLSTRDLCVLDMVPALAELGIDSLKLEGRLKRPEYVSAVTHAYRRAIDGASSPEDREALAQLFNRGGFTQGYLPGVKDTELMYPVQPNHAGVTVGRCVSPGRVRLERPVLQADALALRGAGHTDRPVKLSGAAGDTVPCPGAVNGDSLIRLVSSAQLRTEQERVRTEFKRFFVPAELTARVGSPLALNVGGITVQGEIVQPARSRGTDPERLRAQLNKTGNTPYELTRIDITADDNAFVPVSGLNALRREALDALTAARLPAPLPVNEPLPLPEARPTLPDRPELAVCSSDPAVLCRAIRLGADRALFSPDDVRPEAIASALALLPDLFELVLPPVLAEDSLLALHRAVLPAASRITRTWHSNIAHFDLQWPGERAADFTLNAASREAVQALTEMGCTRIAPSVELNTAQLALLGIAPELVVQGRLPLMYLRHCPLRAVGSMPGPHAECRRCDACAPKDRLTGRSLTDRTGAAFPLKRLATNNGCVIRLYNSVPLMLLRRADRLHAGAWRLLIDNEQQLSTLLPLYILAAEGKDPRADARFTSIENENSTSGHLFRGVE